MIPYVTHKELWRTTMKRSTLITIPRLREFLEFNNEFSGDEVFSQIIIDAKKKFEHYYPLYRLQQTYLKVDANHRAQLEGNFDDWLKGIINEDQIFLLPGAVLGMSMNSTVSTTYPLRDYHYDQPYFTDIWYSTNRYWMSCLCYRPFIEDYNDRREATDNCRLYWMNKDTDVRYTYFKDQLYVELCRYLSNMKLNMQLSNLPIEIFQGLQDDAQRVQGELDRTYDQALTNSEWVM